MRLSLPLQFALLSLLITLIGMVGVTIFSYQSSDQLLRQQALERLGDDLEREREILKGRIETLVEDARFLAKSTGIQGIIRATQGAGYDDQQNMTLGMWHDRLASVFRVVLQQRQAYTQIRFIGAANNGKELVRVERNTQGLIITPGDKLQPKGQHGYFKNTIALQPNGIYISDITLNREHGKITFPPQPMLRIGIPIFGPEGEAFGILVINAHFEQLASSLTRAPGHIYYFLTNERGDYLIHPDSQKQLAFEYSRQARYQDDFNLPRHASGDPTEQKRQWFLSNLASGLALEYLRLDQWQQPGRFLRLGAVAELSVLNSQSKALRDKLVIPLILVAVILSLLTMAMARRLSKPIRLLTEAANEVASGKREVEIPIRGGNETSALGRSMKTMLDRLNASQVEMAELNQSLENQVKVRTQELEEAKGVLEQKNEQLGSALEKANEAALAKSRFLATMSHEIRTPLNGVLGMTELLLDTDINDIQQDYLETVHASGETLLIILNDILDFSKIEAGQFVLNNIDLNPNDIVEHVTHLYAKTAHNKDLEIAGAGLPNLDHMIKGDPDRLRQIVMNLVSNAIKFTEQGDVIARIEIIEESAQEIRLRFEVSDTGIGIAQDKQGQLFQQFVQIDSSSTRRHGGTGLGLAISRQLVELMGGEIGVKSELDKGSLFWFEITFPKGKRLAKEESFNRADLSQWHTLVVDDNRNNREILHHVVTSWGLGNGSVSNGPEALKKLRQRASSGKPYDLALVDHMMPGMDGMELAQKIKQDPALRNTRIIMLSSLDIPAPADQMKASGIDGYLRKPVRQSDLYNLILTVMEVSSIPSIGGREHVTRKRQKAQPRPERILVAEDTLVNQRVIKGMLEKLGFTPDMANDGNEALGKWSRSKYDLILMDIEMPIMDGYEATSKIREQEQLEECDTRVPIIALTAHAMGSDHEKSLEIGMDAHLVKPIDVSRLSEMLKTWLPQGTAPIPVHPTTTEKEEPAESRKDAEAGENEAVNHHVLRRLQEAIDDDIGELIDAFLLAIPKHLGRMNEGLSTRNFKLVHHAAHSLKSTAGTFGAEQLYKLCLEMEAQAETQELEKTTQLLNIIEAEAKKVEQALEAEWQQD